MIGNFFSNGWKTGPDFPVNGKNFREFSSEWKKCFQWLENFRGGGGAVFGLAWGRGEGYGARRFAAGKIRRI